MFLLNALKTPDIVFFVLIAVLVALVVLGYFLISFFKRKMYAERRASLKERESQFRENLSTNKNIEAETSDGTEENQSTMDNSTPPNVEENEELNKEDQALEAEQTVDENETKAE